MEPVPRQLWQKWMWTNSGMGVTAAASLVAFLLPRLRLVLDCAPPPFLGCDSCTGLPPDKTAEELAAGGAARQAPKPRAKEAAGSGDYKQRSKL